MQIAYTNSLEVKTLFWNRSYRSNLHYKDRVLENSPMPIESNEEILKSEERRRLLEDRSSISKDRASMLSEFISQERYANRQAWIYALIVFVIGIIFTFLAYIFAEDAKLMTPLGLVISTFLSLLPLRDNPLRRNKIRTRGILREKYRELIKAPGQVSDSEFAKMENLYMKLLEASAGVR